MHEQMRARSRTATLTAVYGSALLNGLAVVSFPASANELKSAHGFSDAQYGAIFLPQVALTILGSAAGGALANRLGLFGLLRAALLSFLGAQAALAFTAHAQTLAYPALLCGTGLAGLGFGLAAAPLNTLPGVLFPRRAESALVALHTVIGAGFALGPVLVGALSSCKLWELGPLGVCAAASGLFVLTLFARATASSSADSTRSTSARPNIAPFLAIAVLYAFAEGTFSNWASVYLHEERALSNEVATLALSLFWTFLVLGRLIVAALLLRVRAVRIWLSLPALMVLAFLLLPSVRDARSASAVFALAGLGCGAFFPLTVSQAVLRAPNAGARISSATAALMLGVGLGSFLIGPLRSSLSIANIYVISAAYPVIAGALAARSLGYGKLPSQKSHELV